MTIQSAVLPEGVAPGLPARGQSVAISAAGVNDLAAVARQQLPSAVPAPALIAAYNTSIQPQPKPARTTMTAPPSSALAAQFIAQDAVQTPEDLTIFVAPTPRGNTAATESAGDDFLTQLRIARGDIPAAKLASQPPPAQAALAPPPERMGVAQFVAALPAVVQQWIRHPTLLNVRGVAAYQLAQTRNALGKKTATVDAL